MDNVLNIEPDWDWDFDGLWNRCDDLFLIILSLLLIGLGVFIGLNVPTKHVIHNVMWKCKHNEEEKEEEKEEEEEEEKPDEEIKEE
jgi:flagellar biosynthesis component FlhA